MNSFCSFQNIRVRTTFSIEPNACASYNALMFNIKTVDYNFYKVNSNPSIYRFVHIKPTHNATKRNTHTNRALALNIHASDEYED